MEARTAKTDAALFATILAAQGVLAGLWLRRHARGEALALGMVLLFWGALGVGILLKGPIILLVTGGTVLWLSVAEAGARLAGAAPAQTGIAGDAGDRGPVADPDHYQDPGRLLRQVGRP